jgi:hypothetical protein
LAYSGQEIGGTPIAGSVLTLSAAGAVTAEYAPFMEGILEASAGGNSEQMLVSWQDATTQGLWGQLLSKADGWGESFVLTEQVTEGTPAICWDGAEFVVVWGEERTALWSRSVSPDGSLSEAERLFVGDYGWPHLTAGAEGRMLLSYVRWLESSRSRRIESRLVGVPGDDVDVLPPDPDPGDATGGAGATATGGTGGTGAGGAGGTATGGSEGTALGGQGGAGQAGAAAGATSSGQGGEGATGTDGAAGSSVTDPTTAPSSTLTTAEPTGSEEPSTDVAGASAAGAAAAGAAAVAKSDAAGSESEPTAEGDEEGETEESAAEDSSGSSGGGGCSVGSRGDQTSGPSWLALLLGGMALRRRRAGPAGGARS